MAILIAILGPVRTLCLCPGTKMDAVQTRQCPELNVHKQLGKCKTIEKSATHLEVVLQQCVRK